MTMTFIYWNDTPMYDTAIKHAVAFAGMPVVVVSDRAEGKDGATWINIREYNWAGDIANTFAAARQDYGAGWFEGTSIARWFILRNLIEMGKVSLPVFSMDRDELVFQDCAKAHAAFPKCDYITTTDNAGHPRAPLAINRLEPLSAFCDLIQTAIRRGARSLACEVDMVVWELNAMLCGWIVGDAGKILNGSVFDHHLREGKSFYRFDCMKDIKDVLWLDKKPYFVSHHGDLVRANTCHFWGPLKPMMPEFSIKAGL